jgi:hypothetical protein
VTSPFSVLVAVTAASTYFGVAVVPTSAVVSVNVAVVAFAMAVHPAGIAEAD